jgi:hypothetical protein
VSGQGSCTVFVCGFVESETIVLPYLLMGNAIVEQGLVPARLGVKAGFSVSVIAWASRDYCQL